MNIVPGELYLDQVPNMDPAGILSYRAIQAGLASRIIHDWTPNHGEFLVPFGAYVLPSLPNTTPVGLALLRGTQEKATIYGIATKRDCPARIVGTFLTEQVLQEAIDMGIQTVTVDNDERYKWLGLAAKKAGFSYVDRKWVYPSKLNQF